MIVDCRHGFLKYFPKTRRDLRTFERQQKVKLEPEGDYFTFESLIGLPRYSLQGSFFGNLPALVTYEAASAAEVMQENGFVYNLNLDLLVPVESILGTITLPSIKDYWLAPSCFLQSGIFLQNGLRVLSYQGEIDFEVQRLYIYSLEFSI